MEACKAGLALVVWCLVAMPVGLRAQQEDAGEATARAFAIAGEDLRAEAEKLCPSLPAPPLPAPSVEAVSATSSNYHEQQHDVIPPTRVFDTLYYTGNTGVGASALRTSEGIILIDSMTNDEEVTEVLLPGLSSLGLDPDDIRYVIVTHAHGDHHGGLRKLRELHPDIRVVMSEADWAFSKQPFVMRDGTPDPAPKPARMPQDLGYRGTYELTLGDTTVRLFETPGHTPGTTSLLYPVALDGNKHVALQWGGGNPTQPDFSPEVVEAFVQEARQAGAALRWASHAQPEDIDKLARLREGADRHPYLYGTDRFRRYLDILLACKAASTALAAAED